MDYQFLIKHLSFVDLGWLNSVNINLTAVNQLANKIVSSRELKGEYRAAWILKAITLIDLTTLAGDDTNSNVSRLCFKVKEQQSLFFSIR